MPLTVIDLFSGIGGLSLGFQMSGFECLAGVEHNPHHQQAFKSIHPAASIAFNDVGAVTGKALLKEIGLRKGEIDTLVGGPPCQPFSMAGKRKGTADHRGKLIDEFVRLVEETRPRSFVMENVVGLASIHDGHYLNTVLKAFSELGYTVPDTPSIVNAADYGVPQFRRRVFIVGLLKTKRFEFPPKTHAGSFKKDQLILGDHLRNYVTVSDAIADLPSNGHLPDSAEIEDDVALPYGLSKPENPYQAMMRNGRRRVTGNQISVHQPHILEMISLNNLPHGAEEPRTRYRRLYPDRPSFTLRAGSGSFTALRPIHPFRARVITVREAARLQSFPDYVEFSPIKKWAYQQIGNSVPPLLGKVIATRLADFLS